MIRGAWCLKPERVEPSSSQAPLSRRLTPLCRPPGTWMTGTPAGAGEDVREKMMTTTPRGARGVREGAVMTNESGPERTKRVRSRGSQGQPAPVLPGVPERPAGEAEVRQSRPGRLARTARDGAIEVPPDGHQNDPEGAEAARLRTVDALAAAAGDARWLDDGGTHGRTGTSTDEEPGSAPGAAPRAGRSGQHSAQGSPTADSDTAESEAQEEEMDLHLAGIARDVEREYVARDGATDAARLSARRGYAYLDSRQFEQIWREAVRLHAREEGS